MLICNEGPPRAGKSYDCVKVHILPALKAGRRVYARLNGLDYEKIAAYLELPLSRVQELLTSVSKEQVKALFTSFDDDPPRFQVDRDSLIVIDEVHEFYVSGRQPLPPEQEAFFAKHGHAGLDIVILTQALSRLHSSVRLRIERKSVFTKLNAVGSENKYVVRFYSVGDQMGKFAKISSETREYDPAMFPLYKGFRDGVKNTGAYQAGSKTVWASIAKPAIFVGLAVLVGIFAIGKFFTGGTQAVVKEGTEEYPLKGEPVPPRHAPPSPAAAGAVPITQAPAPPSDDDGKYPYAIRHVIELGRSARPRFSGTIGTRYLLEWRTPQGSAIERMTSDQVEAMGWHLVREAYGVVATYADRTVLFTAWPIDPVFTQSSATTQRIHEAAGAPGAAPLVSATSLQGQGQGAAPGGGAVLQATQQTGYGGIGYGGGDRASTAGESPAKSEVP
ncbi:zonular occludens toxin domain-containing protein [Lysobacter capsici]|uniref:zonular occludens toxin domain-containing protein n=1 Tax=Lysobacter capsici TaxID=435897 RepID=UPI00287BB1D1|nr:zonular occludens toxin domain-containing protein [Lysobacter capsici]WND83116.1 zonular occludens toxin domain-containing protein [Lysobacter capsici]WND88315.1 zonular occludens toxin domain-containing protein [Lysobacter capsici]